MSSTADAAASAADAKRPREDGRVTPFFHPFVFSSEPFSPPRPATALPSWRCLTGWLLRARRTSQGDQYIGFQPRAGHD
jgi:hypothetical protein